MVALLAAPRRASALGVNSRQRCSAEFPHAQPGAYIRREVGQIGGLSNSHQIAPDERPGGR